MTSVPGTRQSAGRPAPPHRRRSLRAAGRSGVGGVNTPPWKGVDWSLTYIGLLAYVWIVTTYSFQGGDIAMAVALAGLVFQRERLVFPLYLVFYAAFLAWGAIGYASTDYPAEVALRLNAGWKVGLIALVTVNVLRSPARVRFFNFFFLAAYALYPVRGTLFSYAAGSRVFGRALWNYVYGNPNDLAALTLFPLAMSIGVFLTEPPGWPKKAALSGVVLLPVVIVLTQSRGAFLALAVFAAFAIKTSNQKTRMMAVVAIIFAVVVVATPGSAWQRFSRLRNATSTATLEQVDPEGSAEQRFQIWKVAGAIIRDNPLKGVGVGAYKSAHESYAAGGDFSPIASGPRDTHSTYLNVMAETGMVGFSLFAGILVTAMLRAERVRRRIRDLRPRQAQQLLYLNLGLLGYLLAGVFGSFAGLAFPYIYLSLLVALSTLLERQGQPPVTYERSRGRVARMKTSGSRLS